MISDTDFLVFLTLNMWPSLAAQLVRRTMSRSVGAILAVLWIRMPVYEGSMPYAHEVGGVATMNLVRWRNDRLVDGPG